MFGTDQGWDKEPSLTNELLLFGSLFHIFSVFDTLHYTNRKREREKREKSEKETN